MHPGAVRQASYSPCCWPLICSPGQRNHQPQCSIVPQQYRGPCWGPAPKAQALGGGQDPRQNSRPGTGQGTVGESGETTDPKKMWPGVVSEGSPNRYLPHFLVPAPSVPKAAGPWI